MEKVVVKRSLKSEGIPPLVTDSAEALEIFAELLERGASFYPNHNEAAEGYPRVYRVVALAES
jgi:hypothetical protein